jgi:hypothetical protein
MNSFSAIDIIRNSDLEEKEINFFAGTHMNYYVTLLISPVNGLTELCICCAALNPTQNTELRAVVNMLIRGSKDTVIYDEHSVVATLELKHDWITRMHSLLDNICKYLSSRLIPTACPACGKEDEVLGIGDTGRGKIFLCRDCLNEMNDNILKMREDAEKNMDKITYSIRQSKFRQNDIGRGVQGALLWGLFGFFICAAEYAILASIAKMFFYLVSYEGNKSLMLIYVVMAVTFIVCVFYGYRKYSRTE